MSCTQLKGFLSSKEAKNGALAASKCDTVMSFPALPSLAIHVSQQHSFERAIGS